MVNGRLLLALCALAVSVSAPSFARTEADEKTGRYVFACDSAGKPEAVYECSLASTVKAGVISNAVADACRADTAGAGGRRHAETWACAKLRQFAAGMPQREWHSATMTDCQRRSQRPGHRYQGKNHQCVVDAYIEQKRAPATRIAECEAKASAHERLTCLAREEPRAAAQPAPPPELRAAAPSEEELRQLRAQTPSAQVLQHNRQACQRLSAQATAQVKLDCGCIEKETVRVYASGRPNDAYFEALDKAPCLDRQKSAAVVEALCNNSRGAALRCACLADAVRDGTMPASDYIKGGLHNTIRSVGHKCPPGPPS